MTMRTALHTAGSVEGALDGRLDSGSLWALNGPGPLDVRTGVVYAPGNPMAVTGTSATSPWAVTVNPGHVVGSKGISNGPYIACNDALTTVTLAVPPATNSRIDVIYAMQLDTAAIVSPDGSTAATLAAVTGTASASPAVPAIPTGAVALAQVLIASTATTGTSGAGVTITQVFLWTATRGDPIPVRNVTERAAITTYDGLQVYRLDTHIVETFNSTAWTGALARFRGTLASSVAITNGVAMAFTATDDPTSGWSTNAWAITVTGTYLVTGMIRNGATGVTNQQIIFDNGSTVVAVSPNFTTIAFGGGQLSRYLRLSAGVVVRMYVAVSYTTANDASSNNWLEIVQVGF